MTVAISTHETRQVISAIVEVIDKGNVPAWAPGKYRQALRDLCDGRVDRTNRRKDLLERAEKGLAPVLEAADRQTLLSTNVETLFGGAMIYRKLQPGLPSPQLHEKFEHTYVAKGGETVAEVAKKYGYDNAGPLCHASYDYPPNMRLQTGDTIYIPYRPRALEQLSKMSVEMIKKAGELLKEFTAKQKAEIHKLENFLLILDGIAIVAQLGATAGVGAARGASAGAKAGAKLTGDMAYVVKTPPALPPEAAKALEKVATTVAKDVAKEAARRMAIDAIKHDSGKALAEVVHLASEACGKPESAPLVLIRHVFGPLSPSWWASQVTALVELEEDISTYGPEGWARRRREKVATATEHMCFLLNLRVEFMTAQMNSPIYTHRCARCLP